MDTNIYQTGFRNYFSTQAIENTLPQGQNSPQKVAHGLYTEQLSGTAFTAPRHQNLHSWLYRIQPSVKHGEFQAIEQPNLLSSPLSNPNLSPNQYRWDPLPAPDGQIEFLPGIVTFALNGHLASTEGAAIHHYVFNCSMENSFFYNADGELLFLPQHGSLELRTELGILDISPGELAVIPRGIKFQVKIKDPKADFARGYLLENYGAPLQLPELGPIGANGLANPQDFKTPVAFYEDLAGKFTLYSKFQGKLWACELTHSPLDVVAWRGNYAPYKYDLRLFNTINTVSYDHPDPSIFTVLTSPTTKPGVANVDFVIFPERWMVAENTFRPPYFHRNIMSEYMGLIFGKYDAKQGGFIPGGASLHNCMSAHGPDHETFEAASNCDLQPQKITNTLAFMFESHMVWQATDYAMMSNLKQKDYQQCWQGLTRHFTKNT